MNLHMKKSTKILIIDGEDSFVGAATAAFCANYQVQSTGTSKEGLKIARETQPDLILLGDNIPDMTLITFGKALSANPETTCIPVIADSSSLLRSLLRPQPAHSQPTARS